MTLRSTGGSKSGKTTEDSLNDENISNELEPDIDTRNLGYYIFFSIYYMRAISIFGLLMVKWANYETKIKFHDRSISSNFMRKQIIFVI